MGYIVFCDHGLPNYLCRDIIPYIDRAARDMGWKCRIKETNGKTKISIKRLGIFSILDMELDSNRKLTMLPLGLDYANKDYNAQYGFEGNILGYMKSDCQKPS